MTKTIKKILFSLILCFCFVININSIAADEIKIFDITLDVKETGLIHVKQKINMNFSSRRHGIYANIPQMYTMNFDGNTKRYFFPISNVSVKKYPFELESELDGVSIKIGDADKYVSGNVKYEYEYDIQTRDLKYNDMQMLYFNLVGDKWENDIKKVKFKINMPKSFSNKPQFYPPVTSKTKVTYKKSGNSIIGEYNDKIIYGEALTVKLDLASDYFVFPSMDRYQSIIMMIAGLLTGLIIVLFLKFGKDRKIIKTVEFKAPDGMSSAQVGYVVDGAIQSRDITSLFVYWASKGYLSIKELKDGEFEFKKEKEIGNNEINVEKTIFNMLFSKGNSVKSDNVPEGYFDVIVNLTSDYKADFKHKKQPIFEAKSNNIQGITFALVSILIAANLGLNTYTFFNDWIISIILMAVTFVLYVVFGLIILSTLSNRQVKKKSTNFLMSVLAIITTLIFSVLYCGVTTFFGVSLPLQIAILVLGYISLVFVAFMDKRTKQGAIWLGQLLGLRDFIKYAEKEKLEMLVKDNPQYFYDILPYAYVLNVSDTWIKQFENIEMQQPYWYHTSSPMNNYLFISSLNNSMHNMNSSVGQIPTPEGGSGGFSGSSGGGFSGGGFGGGGGGSW
ncbi:putative membrane protein YgcG [Bacilli bacterium PM5-3]|nr:putative membrane protein YgcG [Bacilli bacterium PM5-3]